MSTTGFLSQAKAAFDDVVISTIFDENATAGDLLKVVAVLAVSIYVVFALLEPILFRLLTGPLKPTYLRIAELEFNRPDKVLDQEIFNLTNKQEYFDHIVRWLHPILIAISTHIVGGMCTVPFVFGLTMFSTSVRSSIACLGILIEMAYEVQDFAGILFYRLFMGAEGALKYPVTVIVILSVHHALTCSMGVPMILNYRELPELHRMSFDLQLGAGLVFLLSECSRSLDVTKKNDLRKFLFITLIMFIMMTWTRLFDWFYLSYKLLARFHADENWTFLVVGAICISVFSLFNVFAIVIPTFQRLTKFMKKLNEYESLPADAPETTRRASVLDLQIAAADVTAIETSFDETMIHLARFGFEDRRVERRQTFNSSALSRSATLARRMSGAKHRPHRKSMLAWRDLPSREEKVAENKAD